MPDQNYDNFFYWVPLLDLPKILAPNILEQCPQPIEIKVNDNKLEEWEMLLGVDQKVKIGLCWQGDPSNPRDHLNSVNLSMFKDVLSIPNASFISLQKGYARNQIQTNEFEKQIIDYDPLIDQGSNKFLDTTAILKYLDLVITTDTSIAHLAGSLGTQTWILLSKVPDWRWFLDKEDSVWYDNMRLFRQTDHHWEKVFKNLKNECEALVNNISEIRKETEATSEV